MAITVNSTLEEIAKHSKNTYSAKRAQALADNESTATLQKKTVTDNYNAQIGETESSYEDDYRENAVQKLINEREVAENMANLGLTDSGLNRTQQTAVQLSYANNKANIDKQKRSMVDSLTQAMTAKLAEIETTRIGNASSINQAYDSAEDELTQNIWSSNQEALAKIREAEIESATEIAKAQISAAAKKSATAKTGNSSGGAGGKSGNITKFAYGTSISVKNASNGNVTYTDNNGNSITVLRGTNPYTASTKNARNKDVLTNGEYDPSKVFSNGYQPNNVNGKPLSAWARDDFYADWRTDGKPQTVWTTDGGKTLYVWKGIENRYIRTTYNAKTGEYKEAK